MMKNITSLLPVILLVVLFTGCRQSNKIIGIKIYEYQGDFNELISTWNDTGINTAFVSKELAADMVFRQVLKENNIPVYIICPVFYNPDALQADSTLFAVTDAGAIAIDEWVRFVCPSRPGYRAEQADHIARLVKDLDPDGISIDFIRQFVFWETIFPDRTPESIRKACFCGHCIADFSRKENIVVPDTCKSIVQKAKYLLSNHSDRWNNYRTDLVASMVKEIGEKVKRIKPEIKLNVHAVPWRNEDFGGANISVAAQDLQKLEPLTDFISPMCYSKMVKQHAAWISSVVTDMDSKSHNKVLPSIQVFAKDERDLREDDFKKCLQEALKPPSQGIVFWSWALFEKNPGRIAEAKSLLK